MHIIGFNGDIYGKELTVYLDAFIRDIIKFYSEEELAKRIELDKEAVTEGKFREFA